MSANPQPDSVSESERLDAAADAAIATCDGNLRATIQALLVANEFLEARNRELARFISVGFVRSQIPANNKFEDSLEQELGD